MTAEYTLREKGDIQVVNTCLEGTLDGEPPQARGKARVVDKATNAKLKVTFFWPFWGAYWIIGLDEEYQWAVVGHPGRNYLGSLAALRSWTRQSTALVAIADVGYDLTGIVKTLQPGDRKAVT